MEHEKSQLANDAGGKRRMSDNWVIAKMFTHHVYAPDSKEATYVNGFEKAVDIAKNEARRGKPSTLYCYQDGIPTAIVNVYSSGVVVSGGKVVWSPTSGWNERELR